MAEQFLLPGFSKPERPTDSLFLALFPEANAVAQIAQLACQLRVKHRLRGKQIATDRLHVSLHHLGIHSGVPEDIVRQVSAVSAVIAAYQPAFEVKFDRVLSFTSSLDNKPFVLRDDGCNSALMEFHQRLGAPLGYSGKPEFTPHVTLSYDKQSVAEEVVASVSWKVQEFALVHSLRGRSLYIPLARWTLRG